MKEDNNPKNKDKEKITQVKCEGCCFNDLNQTLKILVNEPYKYVLVLSEAEEQGWIANTSIFKFDTYSDNIVSFTLGINIVQKNLLTIALLQGQKQLASNCEDIIAAVKKKQKCIILNFNPIDSEINKIDPLLFAITNGISFIGQEFSNKSSKLASLIMKANDHEGVSFINIIHPCTNKKHLQKSSVKIDDVEEPKTKEQAINLIASSPGKISLTGIIYHKKIKSSYAKNESQQVGFNEVFNKLR